MRETSNISEILMVIRNGGSRLIGIDGMNGSGKSTLASCLSKELNCLHVDIDDYIDKNLGQYVSNIHYDAVQKQLDESKGAVFLEGVCLLAIIENLQLHLDLLIYIKRISDYGSWQNEDNCNLTEDIDQFINKKKAELRQFAYAEACVEDKDVPHDVNFPQLVEEIIRYHYEYRPHEKADIIYRRIDDFEEH